MDTGKNKQNKTYFGQLFFFSVPEDKSEHRKLN